MKVAGIQMDIAWEDPQENFQRARRLAEEAVEDGARMVVLPEMFATGFSMNAERVSGHAEQTREFLSRLATELGVFVLAGFAEPADTKPANACSLFDSAGTELLHYRKIHPFSLAGEDEHFLAGETVATAEVEGIRVTPFICYDLRFPEPFRALAVDTDLFCVLANWPTPRRKHWSRLLVARAIENQAYLLGVNRVGVGDGLDYTGDSALLDPMGQELAASVPGVQGIILADVDAAEVARARERFGFLNDRRTALYRQIEDSRR
jgi:predicted amidohydrolase